MKSIILAIVLTFSFISFVPTDTTFAQSKITKKVKKTGKDVKGIWGVIKDGFKIYQDAQKEIDKMTPRTGEIRIQNGYPGYLNTWIVATPHSRSSVKEREETGKEGKSFLESGHDSVHTVSITWTSKRQYVEYLVEVYYWDKDISDFVFIDSYVQKTHLWWEKTTDTFIADKYEKAIEKKIAKYEKMKEK